MLVLWSLGLTNFIANQFPKFSEETIFQGQFFEELDSSLNDVVQEITTVIPYGNIVFLFLFCSAKQMTFPIRSL